MNLRWRQGDHSLILLHSDEFTELKNRKEIFLPVRHRDHFARVLRRKTEWPALVGDGSGILIEAQIRGESITLTDATPLALNANTPRHVTLVQAWVKQKALAIILQKAAEIGANEIVLVDTEYSQAPSEKAARIDAILENACMQAYNPRKPQVTLAKNLKGLQLEKDSAFFGDLGSQRSLAAIGQQRDQSAIFINGPEGGFSSAELAYLSEHATGVLISENVLRSDSAAIIALGYLRLPE